MLSGWTGFDSLVNLLHVMFTCQTDCHQLNINDIRYKIEINLRMASMKVNNSVRVVYFIIKCCDLCCC
jgi:hypothetical protein